jgi:WD40 repeat protein
LSLNRIVALKVVLHGPFSSRDFVRRFRQEAQAVAALRHPNIVTIYDVGEHDGNHFLALEFVEGSNFAELIRERPLPARRAAGYLHIIAQAVEHAHQRGVLHRDLKPSNVLLDVFDQPRVTDFGLAKIASQDLELTVTGQVLGSPNYMPPEQAAGKFSDSSPAADVYSLGAILYELLTARPPFQGETLQAVLAQVQNAEPLPPLKLNPDVPVDLQTICLKCLQKDPARRYATAGELAADLGCFLDGKPIRARPVPTVERAWLWCRRRPVLAALSSGLVAAVILGVAGIVWQWRAAEFHAEGEEKQRLIAEQDDAVTRLNLYAADIAVAAQQVQNGHPGLARSTLARLRPMPGAPDLRGFEWRYLWHRSRGDQLLTLKGHMNTVGCAAFSPDGQRLATGGHDGRVRIWEAGTGALITSLNVTTSAVWSVGFTPDARWLMAGCNENVQLWDTTSWTRSATYPGELAALSLAGTLLATAESSPFFFEKAGAVRVWDWHTGRLVARFAQPGRALALSPDGRLLAVAGATTGLTVYEISSQKIVRQWPTADSIWSLSFSPDSRRLLSTGWTKDVSVWSVDVAAPPQIISGHQLHVWDAVFSADGSTIATASSDQTAGLWDATTLALKTILHGHSSEVWCVAFNPNGRILATGSKDQTAMLWHTMVTTPQNEVPDQIQFCPLFSPNGKWLVTVNPATSNYMLWQAADFSLVNSNLALGRRVAGFSRDGNTVATFDTEQRSLEFWRPAGVAPEAETLLAGVSTNDPAFENFGFSPGQEHFFAIDATGVIRIWAVDTGRLMSRMQGPFPPIRNAVLSPQGRQIAVSVELENFARLYDSATGRERDLTGHRDFVSGLAFSPDGATLATGSMDGSIRLWNTTNGTCVATLAGHLQETTDVAFSPDGRTLASIGRGESLKLWHVPTLREVYSENEPHAGQWLRFSPNGWQLAMSTDTDKLRILSAPPD